MLLSGSIAAYKSKHNCIHIFKKVLSGMNKHKCTHIYTYIHKNNFMPATSQPLCIKDLGRQRVCPERQTAGSTETAMNMMHIHTHQATPTSMLEKQQWTPRTESKNELIAKICIPWMSCILPQIPGRPKLKPCSINTTPSRAYTCVPDRRGPHNTHRQCHTLLLFCYIVWPETNPRPI